jgi:hypothetical protein
MAYLRKNFPALLIPFGNTRGAGYGPDNFFEWSVKDFYSGHKYFRNLFTKDNAAPAKNLLFVVTHLVFATNILVPKLDIPGVPFVYQLDCFIVRSKVTDECQLFYRSKDDNEFHGFSIENNQDIRFTDKFVWSSNNEIFTPPDSSPQETLVYALVYKRKLVNETRPSNSIHLSSILSTFKFRK